MSTRITDVIDTLRTTVYTLFPTKTEIPNPYSLIDNNEMFLENGVAVRIENGQSAGLQLFNHDIDRRIFGIYLTKKIFRTDADSDPIKDAEKALLEDQVTLRKELLKNTQMGIDAKIFKIDFIGDSGVQFIYNDDFSFLSIKIDFAIEIAEEI